MVCQRYFQHGQKVTVRTLDSGRQGTEVLSAQLAAVNAEIFAITLPYPARKAKDQTLFPSGTEACILSEAFGLGIQVRGRIEEQLDEKTLLVRHHGALEMVPRRKFHRVETTLGIHFRRSRASFATLRQQWSEAVQRVANGEIPTPCAALSRQSISLCAGGVGALLERPVAETDLFLVLFDIGDGKGPIWTVGEAVWVHRPEGNLQRCGLRFVEIELADMDRVNDFVIAELKKRGENVVWYSGLRKKLPLMEF